jgi:hypothetical protein
LRSVVVGIMPTPPYARRSGRCPTDQPKVLPKMKLSTLSFSLFLALSTFGAGCAAESAGVSSNDENEIVDIPQTDVERQAIGNCWLYSHASWVESMHLAATGDKFDVSQSYWTYFHWFDQVARGFTDKISTGGNWQTANSIVRRYGLMSEADFIASDTAAEMSSKQKQAMEAINLSLKSGVLSTPEARRNKKLLRAELDAAWGLTPEQTAMLDRVFGADVSKTLDRSASAAGTKIIPAESFQVQFTHGPGTAARKTTLDIAQASWRQTFFSPSSQRSFLQRVQRALHDRQPVILTWFVDFNAIAKEGPMKGSFNIDTLNANGSGRQGGHMVVLEDYQATLADGTVLAAGVTLDPVKDAKLLAKAVEPATKIEFLRVKNSWGANRPDFAFAPGMPGYHDLYMNYLGGRIPQCNENEDGTTNPEDCPFETTPLKNVVLPPGY